MKKFTKRSLAWLASLMLFVSLFATVLVLPVQAATVDYVYSGNYVYNWGQRDELATFLSPMAEDFYDENGVTYTQLASYSGSSTVSSVPYSALFSQLHELMYNNLDNPTSYDATRDQFKYTDCENSGGSISSFYSGKAIGPAWDSGKTWNREHVWPNSKSNGKSDTNTQRETDIMMLRPASVSENSSRSNTAYGESSNFYDPNELGQNVRGDAARIVLYVYVCWGGSDKHDGALDYMWGASGVMESKDILLKWIEEDPVDTWELGRNDSVEAITGTRNVFVDYPELAFLLFDEEVPDDYASPSGEKTPSVIHDYKATITVAPTCDKAGVRTYTCTECGDSYTESIPATGHKMVNGVCSVCGIKKQSVTFTLGLNGNASHQDGTSNASYSETVDGYTLNIVSGVKMYTTAIDAKGNSCIKLGTSSGVGSFNFTVPDEVSSVVIHIAKYKANATKIKVNGVEYTINGSSNDGQYDAIEVDTSVNKTVSVTTVSGGVRAMVNTIEYVMAKTCDHVYTSSVTTSATCDANGVRTYTCSACGDSYTEVIPATGHSYKAVVTAPDCVNGGYTTHTCPACGDSYKDTYTSALGHTPGADADCENDQVCTVCGEVLQTALGHSYKAVVTAPDCVNDGYTTHTCSACDDSYKDTYTSALGHTYDNACDADCNVCDDVREVGDHVYDNANDTTCNECGAVRQIAAQVLAGGQTSVSEDVNGLAFFFTANVSGAQTQNGYEYVTDSASVIPFVGGESYSVVRMGAVISNGVSSVDVEAQYLWDWTADEVSFAVRLIDIPDTQLDRVITARPYYVYLVDGEEIVVYGEAVSKSYNEAAQ